MLYQGSLIQECESASPLFKRTAGPALPSVQTFPSLIDPNIPGTLRFISASKVLLFSFACGLVFCSFCSVLISSLNFGKTESHGDWHVGF